MKSRFSLSKSVQAAWGFGIAVGATLLLQACSEPSGTQTEDTSVIPAVSSAPAATTAAAASSVPPAMSSALPVVSSVPQATASAPAMSASEAAMSTPVPSASATEMPLGSASVSALASVSAALSATAPMPSSSGSVPVAAGEFEVTSPDHVDGMKFADALTCAGTGNFSVSVSPELNWTGVPEGTKSFAVTFIDHTASGDLGQHWAIWNIPATVTQLPGGLTAPLPAELGGASQTNKYLGPCPSGNLDSYEFTVYALSVEMLDVTGATGMGVANTAGVKNVVAALVAAEAQTLGTASLTGTSDASP
jgi:Raf kinase inhibitor-like YbhB/YbcL family protein